MFRPCQDIAKLAKFSKTIQIAAAIKLSET